MEDHGEDKVYCDFHPMEPVVGVCANCLKEKLLVLATEQGHRPLTKKTSDSEKKTSTSFRVLQRKHAINFPKVFVLYRHEARYNGDKDESDDEGSISSDQDSFISVKFDDNGHAFWDKTEAMTITTTMSASTNTQNRNEANRNKNAVEKTKKNNTLKWKKRIGQLLQLGRLKQSTNKSNLHRESGRKLAIAKGRKDWVIRSLVRRRTT